MGRNKVNRYVLSHTGLQHDRILGGLKLLELQGAHGSYPKLLAQAVDQSVSHADFLENLIRHQIEYSEENRIQRWMQQARFPAKNTIEGFDFSFQPTVPRQKIMNFASCQFIPEGENIIFLGPPGVGKTHLSIALGEKAIFNGYEVKFHTLEQIIDLVKKYVNDGIEINKLTRNLTRPNLLILDEMDLYDVDKITSTFLIKIFTSRHDNLKSIIVTSTKGFKQWRPLFGGIQRSGSILDRLNHRGAIININGPSYRIKDKVQEVGSCNCVEAVP